MWVFNRSSLVHAYVKAGQTDQALGAIERMKLAGYPLVSQRRQQGQGGSGHG